MHTDPQKTQRLLLFIPKTLGYGLLVTGVSTSLSITLMIATNILSPQDWPLGVGALFFTFVAFMMLGLASDYDQRLDIRRGWHHHWMHRVALFITVGFCACIILMVAWYGGLTDWDINRPMYFWPPDQQPGGLSIPFAVVSVFVAIQWLAAPFIVVGLVSKPPAGPVRLAWWIKLPLALAGQFLAMWLSMGLT